MCKSGKKIKVRLVIPICDVLFNKYYCCDSLNIKSRLNLLKKAIGVSFKGEDKNNEKPDIIITSNNFFFIPLMSYAGQSEYLLETLMHCLVNKAIKDEKDNRNSYVHLFIGVDSLIENPYGGINSKVFYFKIRNNNIEESKFIWECWSSEDRKSINKKRKEIIEECFKNQNRKVNINDVNIFFLSCGDIFQKYASNYIKDKILKDNKDSSKYSLIIDLAHMDFRKESLRNTKYTIDKSSYVIITTQISREELITKKGKVNKDYFIIQNEDENINIYYCLLGRIINGGNKIEFPTESNLSFPKVSIIALDKQGYSYEVIDKFNFFSISHLEKVDAFLVDFELDFQEFTTVDKNNK